MVKNIELWLSLRLGVACLLEKKPISKRILLAFFFFFLKEYVALDGVVSNRSWFETWKQCYFLFLNSEVL